MPLHIRFPPEASVACEASDPRLLRWFSMLLLALIVLQSLIQGTPFADLLCCGWQAIDCIAGSDGELAAKLNFSKPVRVTS